MAVDFTIKVGEGKPFTFTLQRYNSVTGLTEVLDLSAATLSLVVKEDYDDTAYLIEKTTSDFDVTYASTGIITTTILASESALLTGNKIYLMELKTIITADEDVDYSETYKLKVDKSVHN